MLLARRRGDAKGKGTEAKSFELGHTRTDLILTMMLLAGREGAD